MTIQVIGNTFNFDVEDHRDQLGFDETEEIPNLEQRARLHLQVMALAQDPNAPIRRMGPTSIITNAIYFALECEEYSDAMMTKMLGVLAWIAYHHADTMQRELEEW